MIAWNNFSPWWVFTCALKVTSQTVALSQWLHLDDLHKNAVFPV